MTVSAILDDKGRTVHCLPPGATVADIVRLLRQHGIGAVLVVEAGAPPDAIPARHLMGMVSERDIVRALAGADAAADVLDMSAVQIMTEIRCTVTPSTSIADAALLMTERRVRHLPVIERDSLAGMITIGDVVAAGIRRQARGAESLRAPASGA